jgi:hypothetical protein
MLPAAAPAAVAPSALHAAALAVLARGALMPAARLAAAVRSLRMLPAALATPLGMTRALRMSAA